MHPGDPNDMAAIFFTSGSTGPAKGVIYTSGMLINQIEITKSQFNIGSDETDLCTFPLLGLFAVCHGNSSVLADMDMLHPAKLNPEKIIKNITGFQLYTDVRFSNGLKQAGGVWFTKGNKTPFIKEYNFCRSACPAGTYWNHLENWFPKMQRFILLMAQPRHCL